VAVLAALRTLAGQPRVLPDLVIRRTRPRSGLRAALFRYVDWCDRRATGRAPCPPVPPAALRYRVHGDLDRDSFLETGRQCSLDVRTALAGVGRDLESFRRILDFGCGCGRTLRWFAAWSERASLHGADIDADAIRWCQGAIRFARFTVNSDRPPLGYPDHSFDLVYAISVFTHLPEALQSSWLAELRRVTQPAGFVLLTVRGSSYAARLPPGDAEELRRRGFVFSTMPRHMQQAFPPWYQLATHTEEYVRDTASAYFEVVRYLPRAMDGCQDVVLLRRP
jgi:ubiquinone/menaquinone biosynthesis C-methylase UbiE